jgi:hypothetical protein
MSDRNDPNTFVPDIRGEAISLADETFIPVLEMALNSPRVRNAQPQAVFHAVLNTFGTALTKMIGPQAAAIALREYADHIAGVAPPSSSRDG